METQANVCTAGKKLFGLKTASAAVTDDEFVAFIKDYEVVLYKVAYQYVKNEHDAKEMVSETVYKGYKSRRTLKKPEYFKTWITKILLSTCVNFLKRGKRVVLSGEEMPGYADTYGGGSVEDGMLIDGALGCLRHEYKTVLLLRYYQDLSVKETSKAMGVPENTVKTYTDRALKELRKILKEDVFYG